MTFLRYIPLAAALACGTASAGTATVSFIEPARYTDLGVTADEQQENMHAIARHLDALAQRNLPAGHHVRIDVLDVDLAGKARPSRRSADWVRVVRAIDWPRMELRYTLSVNGQPVQSSQEQVKDQMFAGSYGYVTPLHYEKRMLSRWFRARFGPEAVASATTRATP